MHCMVHYYIMFSSGIGINLNNLNAYKLEALNICSHQCQKDMYVHRLATAGYMLALAVEYLVLGSASLERNVV